MANNSSNVANPYTTQIPSGTINKVQLTNPSHVQIQWPSISGGNMPMKPVVGNSFLRKLFG